jgi:hypothetical protein
MLSQFAVTIVIEWIVKEEVPHILARFNGFTLCVLKTSETSNEVLIIYQILRRNCGLAVVGLVSGCNDFAYQWPLLGSFMLYSGVTVLMCIRRK